MSDGMGAVPNALSFLDICAYADRFHEFTLEEFQVFFHYVTFLDTIALDDAGKKIDRERKKHQSKMKGGGKGRA